MLLLDEPLAALDAQLRQSTLAELQRLKEALPDTAMLYVTHDQAEALALADRIVVMNDARLMDVDTAENLWKRPPTSFTAAFLGGANLIPCTVGRVIGTSALVTFAHKTVSAEAPQPAVGKVDWAPESKALLCIRPHAMRIVSLGERDALRATVARRCGAVPPPGWCCRSAGCRISSSTSTCRATPRSRSAARSVSGSPNRPACWSRHRDRGARTARARADAPARPAARRSRAALWAVPPLLVVLVAAVYPLIRVCLESTKVGDTQRGWSTWSEVLASQMFRDALWRTVAIAATSTVGCLVLGTFLAIVLAFVPFPGSRVVGRLIDTVLALPSFLITLAFTFLYGTGGRGERGDLRASPAIRRRR